MKLRKSVIVSLIPCLFSAGCSTYQNADNTVNSPRTVSVKEISKTNLEHWDISLTPNLEVDAEYLGSVPCEAPTLHTSTGISVSTGELRPHGHLQIRPKRNTDFNGQVKIELSWKENGKQLNGQEIFKVSQAN